METDRAEAVLHEAREWICTDMRAVRKDYFLDHDQQLLRRPVGLGTGDQANQRNIKFLKEV